MNSLPRVAFSTSQCSLQFIASADPGAGLLMICFTKALIIQGYLGSVRLEAGPID